MWPNLYVQCVAWNLVLVTPYCQLCPPQFGHGYDGVVGDTTHAEVAKLDIICVFMVPLLVQLQFVCNYRWLWICCATTDGYGILVG